MNIKIMCVQHRPRKKDAFCPRLHCRTHVPSQLVCGRGAYAFYFPRALQQYCVYTRRNNNPFVDFINYLYLSHNSHNIPTFYACLKARWICVALYVSFFCAQFKLAFFIIFINRIYIL